jgi:hypothetical protein
MRGFGPRYAGVEYMAIYSHINHITKVEFFLAFKAAYFSAMTESNNRGGFRGAG